MNKKVLLMFALSGAISQGVSQTCANPLQISCGQTVQGTTLGEANDFEDYGLNCSGSAGLKEGNDVVYEFVPNTTGEVTADLNNFSGGRIGAFTACMDDSASCIEVSGGFPLPSEITFDVVSGITYYLLVDGTDADDSSTFELVITCEQSTAIQEALADQISIYPNPSNGTLFLKGINLRNTSFDIIDVSGKIVNKDVVINQTTIDANGLSKGIYFVRFRRGAETATKKITIN